MESVPLKASDFAVYVNGHRLYPRSLIGQRIPILEGTEYGHVTGEIVITPKSTADFKDLGVEIKVKGATGKKGLVGMETWGKAVARVKGEINADFLSVTSDRSGFILDSAEYQEFLKVMEKQEISLMKETRSPRLPFNRQSQLLKDAFAEDEGLGG